MISEITRKHVHGRLSLAALTAYVQRASVLHKYTVWGKLTALTDEDTPPATVVYRSLIIEGT